jgi:hypothetical protein
VSHEHNDNKIEFFHINVKHNLFRFFNTYISVSALQKLMNILRELHFELFYIEMLKEIHDNAP